MFDNYLFSAYTLIFMAFGSVNCLLLFRENIKEMTTEDKLKLGLIVIILLPIFYFGLYMAFAIMYMIADMFFGDSDILVTHLVTNIPNFYALYMLIQAFKENKHM